MGFRLENLDLLDADANRRIMTQEDASLHTFFEDGNSVQTSNTADNESVSASAASSTGGSGQKN